MKEFHQINFNKEKDLHHADIAVLSCLDFRFRQADQEAIEKLGYKNVDWFRWPGVTKPMLASENFFELFCQAIENVSIKLHHVNKILLLCHWDCGGYGGSKSFSSEEEEEAKYQSDLKQAKEKLQARFSDLEILIGYSKVSGDELYYYLL